jgi:hypothetical protein
MAVGTGSAAAAPAHTATHGHNNPIHRRRSDAVRHAGKERCLEQPMDRLRIGVSIRGVTRVADAQAVSRANRGPEGRSAGTICTNHQKAQTI